MTSVKGSAFLGKKQAEMLEFFSLQHQIAFQNLINEEFEVFIKSFEECGVRVYRNGFKKRSIKTVLGEFQILVPQTRSERFQPSSFEPYSRVDKCLASIIQECYLYGISTRKMTKILEKMNMLTFDKNSVSRLNQELDEQVDPWLKRKLDTNKTYPYLMVDARYEKVRENNEVIPVAVFVVIGIDSDGTREILTTHIGYEEFKETWLEIFQSLKDRGLKGVKYIVGDYNSGLVEALKETYVGVTYQRCFVHFTRNILSALSKQGREKYINKIKLIWKLENKESALKYAKTIVTSLYENNFGKAAKKIEEGIEESLNYFTLEDNLRRKLSSTNMIERYNQELKRRSKAIRIFPNQKSCLRIMSLLSIAKNEEWTGRKYCELGSPQIEEDSATLHPPLF